MRKIDWEGGRVARLWRDRADPIVLWNRSVRKEQPRRIIGRFEILLTISEAHTAIDLDNGIKVLIDYLRRIQAIEDDSPKFFRKLTVEFGEAPRAAACTSGGSHDRRKQLGQHR
jgi:hypothetical protein